MWWEFVGNWLILNSIDFGDFLVVVDWVFFEVDILDCLVYDIKSLGVFLRDIMLVGEVGD